MIFSSVSKTQRDQWYIFLGVVVCQISLLYAVSVGSLIEWIASFFIYFCMLGLGISLLNHRTMSHKSVKIDNKILRFVLLFFSTISLQGSTLAWVAMHREHHAYSDTDKDPHGPNDGFWKSYWCSMFHTPNIRFMKDYLRDNLVIFFHKHYWPINFLYAVALLFFGIDVWIFGHLVPAALTWHASSLVNAVAHLKYNVPFFIGYRNHNTKDQSKNILLAGYLTFGEAWHNNHHADPKSHTFKSKWWEYDCIGFIAQIFQNKTDKNVD